MLTHARTKDKISGRIDFILQRLAQRLTTQLDENKRNKFEHS